MAIVQQINCDFCGALLVGLAGRNKVSKSYVEMSGFVRDWTADPDTGWREPTFISDKNKSQMAFCTENDATCFYDFVTMKREAWRVKKEQFLRDSAGTEQEESWMRGGHPGAAYAEGM